jgi:hypothetical protein
MKLRLKEARKLKGLTLREAAIEGNKLIAKFDDYLNVDMYDRYFHKGIYSEKLRYHSSWDWLMPVVKKIYSLEYYELSGSKYIDTPKKVIKLKKNIKESIGFAEIENSFKAIIEFIKWYNLNTQTK